MNHLLGAMKNIKGSWIDLQVTLMHSFRRMKEDERGMGMVEIALIIIIMITLGLTFKDKIIELVKNIFDGLSYDGLSS